MNEQEETSLQSMFASLTLQALNDINALKELEKISEFEEKAFSSFCRAANITAQSYLKAYRESEYIPYKIMEIDNIDTIFNAYIFLCATELDLFFRRAGNKAEIRDVMDVSRDKLINDFAEVFGGEEISKYFNKTLESFADIASEIGGPLDLPYNQVLNFGIILSGGKRIAEQIDMDIKAITYLSLLSHNAQMASSRLFDETVLGKGKRNN